MGIFHGGYHCFVLRSVWRGGGVCVLSLPVPSSEVDVAVYIPFFYFYIFFTITPFPQHIAPWTPRWTTKLNNGSPFHPYLSLNRVDRMKSNCGFLRFAGEVRLWGCVYLLDRSQPFKCHYCVVSAVVAVNTL